MKQVLVAAIMLAWGVTAGAGSTLAPSSWKHAARSSPSPAGAMNNSDDALPEIRASIVDREGDQFIAKTEEGHQFRLPVEGAPPGIQIGDALRLVPNPETHTMNVFKADPLDGRTPDGRTIEKPESQL